MYIQEKSLPDYSMTAGEDKNLVIPIYNSDEKQIDMTGMTAKFAISDPINYISEPFVVRDCLVIKSDSSDFAVLRVELEETDTIDLCGQYVYQITIKDEEERSGVLKGVLTIAANYDKAAISV